MKKNLANLEQREPLVNEQDVFEDTLLLFTFCGVERQQALTLAKTCNTLGIRVKDMLDTYSRKGAGLHAQHD